MLRTRIHLALKTFDQPLLFQFGDHIAGRCFAHAKRLDNIIEMLPMRVIIPLAIRLCLHRGQIVMFTLRQAVIFRRKRPFALRQSMKLLQKLNLNMHDLTPLVSLTNLIVLASSRFKPKTLAFMADGT